MKIQRLFFVFVSTLFVLFSCGGDDIEPGEEVVSEKWVDPEDIGKDYSIKFEDIELDVPYRLDTGETVTFKGEIYGAILTENEDGSPAVSKRFLDENGDPVLEYLGTIVPEGDPIVTLSAWGFREKPTREDLNVFVGVSFRFGAKIDRVLDYNLPIYLEYQTQDRLELGGAVERGRFILVVPEGETLAVGSKDVDLGDVEQHERSSLSILPHTEMQKLDLPVSVGFPGNLDNLPVEIRGIPDGHRFRPYRIASPSFVIGQTHIEGNW